MRSLTLFLLSLFIIQPSFSLPAQESAATKKSIYHDTWIDLNKNGRMDVYEDPKAPIDRRVEDLLSQMNLDEKTCQTATLYGVGRGRTGAPLPLKDELPTPDWKNQIWKDGIANIDEHLNGVGPNGKSIYATDFEKHVWAMNEVQRFFIEDTRLGIPADFTNEGLRGVAFTTATSFPSELGMGHTWDPALVREMGRITALEARALGYTNVYAPTLDVSRDQRWGRIEDTYGEDPYLASRLGVEMVKGLQQDYTVASTGKHFAVYSVGKGAREGEARTDPQVSPREVENILLPSFKAAIREGGMLGVMSSYNDYDGIPVTGSKYWLTDRLRTDFGFKGYVVSDSAAVEYLYSKHAVAADMKDAVRQSIEAGLDVKTNFTKPEDFILPLRELVKEGQVSMKTLDDRVRDVLRVKFILGIFDHPYVADAVATKRLVNSAEHQQVALRAARESLVLLKNEKNILPLSKGIKSIAVIGPNADDDSTARYRYGPNAVKGVTVLEEIKTKLAGSVKVNYAKGCEITDAHWPQTEVLPEPPTKEELTEINKAVEAARNSDLAVVVLGDSMKTVGESASRTSLDLPGHQLELVQAVYAAGKPVIVVLINGRPMSINWIDKYVPGIIQAWFPGVQGGTAIADVLFGDYNPGGKLTVTFPKTVGQIPFNFPTKPKAQWEGEKTRVNGALYYFGHGLSYTTFAYSNLKIEPAGRGASVNLRGSSPTRGPQTGSPAGVVAVREGSNLTVSFEVKNTGPREGDEVVQLYTRDLVSTVTTYEKNLRGFERVHLKPGETKTVRFVLHPDDLALWDRNMHFVVEPGKFRVMIGSGSEDIRLTGEFEIVVK
ncbi:MAG TPA: glycoside hydrolase family 3 N-terminal domain-containing protein [Pyrinomonadaceae bacterium]|nr:glycoside hydrolase family 3 N-terminal domain-containing protein [Pyrinomonadaceae bacterium]